MVYLAYNPLCLKCNNRYFVFDNDGHKIFICRKCHSNILIHKSIFEKIAGLFHFETSDESMPFKIKRMANNIIKNFNFNEPISRIYKENK